MVDKIETQPSVLTRSASRRSIREAVLTPFVCAVAASFGIFGGIAALFVGIVFVVIHSFWVTEKMFDQIGTGLLIVGIPMILIGSIFLDEIDRKK